jgi:hypothetical protein
LIEMQREYNQRIPCHHAFIVQPVRCIKPLLSIGAGSAKQLSTLATTSLILRNP